MINHRDEIFGQEQLPAGEYWIGDLCYVMHTEWDEVCELLFEGRDDHGCNQGVFTLKDGRTFAMYNTQYGDGSYYDALGNLYGVDSGSIGCILVDNILPDPDNSVQSGYKHVFTEPFDTGRSASGDIWFGIIYNETINIQTGDDSYEEDDYSYEDDPEE